MKRRLKEIARKYLSPALIHRAKQLFARSEQAGNDTPMRLEEVDGGLRCTLGESISFLAPMECKVDLESFCGTAEGRTEFSGIARLAQRGGTMFDIGAHAGLVSALFCAAKADNRVVCFEPSPIMQRRLQSLRALAKLEDRMQLESVAIGEAVATVTMLVDPVGGFVQSQRFEHSMWGEPEEIPLKVETIPSVSERLGIVPNFIKIDIESYEFEAVSGALEFLTRHKPTLLFEIHLNYLEERHLSPRVLIEKLAGCGYRFFDYDGRSLRPRDIYDALGANFRFYCE